MKTATRRTKSRSQDLPGRCDRCGTYYGVGSGLLPIYFGDRCNDLSLQPESGWPGNACRGIIRPVDEVLIPPRTFLEEGRWVTYVEAQEGSP